MADTTIGANLEIGPGAPAAEIEPALKALAEFNAAHNKGGPLSGAKRDAVDAAVHRMVERGKIPEDVKAAYAMVLHAGIDASAVVAGEARTLNAEGRASDGALAADVAKRAITVGYGKISSEDKARINAAFVHAKIDDSPESRPLPPVLSSPGRVFRT